ncbi:MAG: transcriptional regulator [Betaproteobacteria bacterium]|nr:transcriptional regulator [Betaproteobacteria bacterium]
MSQDLHTRKLLTVICEAGLEEELAADFAAGGACGYTVTDARGQGAHGHRDGSWSSGANIRIEVLCDEPTALGLLEMLATRYFADYYMVAFVSDVAVLRPGKFQSVAN